MRAVNFKITESELERINYYRATPEAGKLLQAEFFAQAAAEKCEALRHQRAGDLSLTIANPSHPMGAAEKAAVIEGLQQAIEALQETANPAAEALQKLIEYLSYHFYEITREQIKLHEAKFIVDLEAEGALDADADLEFEAEQEELKHKYEK